MENRAPLVITVVGAESSGKTTLCKQLALALSCIWVPEYAREYLGDLGRPYEFEDLEKIARGQNGLLPEKFKNRDSTGAKDLISVGFKKIFEQQNKSVGANLKPKELQEEEIVIFLKSLKRDILVIDGGILTIRLWARIKYGKVIPYVEELINKDPTSLYLLCKPRKMWESDPLREAPSVIDRAWIYNQYLHELMKMEVDFLQDEVNISEEELSNEGQLS